jgi:hypothetical protein
MRSGAPQNAKVSKLAEFCGKILDLESATNALVTSRNLSIAHGSMSHGFYRFAFTEQSNAAFEHRLDSRRPWTESVREM